MAWAEWITNPTTRSITKLQQQPDSQDSGCFAFWGLRREDIKDQSLDKSNLWRRHSRVIMNGHRDLRDLFLAAIFATVSFACTRSPTTVDEVIERHTKAMGGRAAIEAIQTVEFDLHITDPKFEVDGTVMLPPTIP